MKVLPFLMGAFTFTAIMVSCNAGPDAEAQADSIQQKKTADSLVVVQEAEAKTK